jgi:hypothetical protein
MRSIVAPVIAAFLALWPAVTRAQCEAPPGPLANGTLAETFEAPSGTDNDYQAVVDPENGIDVFFPSPSVAPATWGTRSAAFVVGPAYGSAYLVNRTQIDSPTGYHFTASLIIIRDGLLEGKGITLFISKPGIGSGNLAAWRLYMTQVNGELNLVLVLGLNTSINNPSAALFYVPITTGEVYDVAITYDTRRRFYLWSVNGAVQAAAEMPCDYPLIGARFIGSSGSSTGRNSTYIVDNVRWYELPE